MSGPYGLAALIVTLALELAVVALLWPSSPLWTVILCVLLIGVNGVVGVVDARKGWKLWKRDR